MENQIIITAVVAIVAGLLVGYFMRKKMAQAQANSIEAKAEKLLTETKTKQQELILTAKDKGEKILDEAKNEEKKIRQELRDIQSRLNSRESMFDQKILEFQDKQTKLQEKIDKVNNIKQQIKQLREDEKEKLAEIAGLSREDATEQLLAEVKKDSSDALMSRTIKLDKEAGDVYDEKAKAIILDAIQRCASSHAAETTSSTVTIPSEEMKGRIIGKEGRNIKTIEKLTGCELIIDETPETIMISGFSPIRRQIAKIALEKLIADGRIQPARIEEFIELAKQELSLEIKKAGEEALYKMGITGIDPKLVNIVGRLKYRTSYGQNILNHSTEIGHLASLIAAELGIDQAKAKKCGFFHDIGKAVDQETQGNHPEIGYAILKKFNMDEDIAKAARDHHMDKPEGIFSVIAKVADAISGARAGARKDTYEQYISRLEDLEKVAGDFPGIEKVYAIQAGREVRIFVSPNEIDDYAAYQLAKDVARKVEQELQYPGEIKVTVLRETKAIEYAR